MSFDAPIGNASPTSPAGTDPDSTQTGHRLSTLDETSSSVPSASTPTSPSTVQRSVAAAAEARAAYARSSLGSPTVEDIDTMRYYRCLDQDLLPPLLAPAQRVKMLGVLATILLLLENALNKGIGDSGDAKYLHIKLSNTAIRQRLDLNNEISKHPAGAPALDWLQLSGWRQVALVRAQRQFH